MLASRKVLDLSKFPIDKKEISSEPFKFIKILSLIISP
jgi:hypothetical protein